MTADSPWCRSCWKNHRMTDGRAVRRQAALRAGLPLLQRRGAATAAALPRGGPLPEPVSGCLDAGIPVVLVVLEGVQASGENRVEAG